jgi:NAD(P)-dependent dehydrogenase (short-subunit alcohol dehydrogenase family)
MVPQRRAAGSGVVVTGAPGSIGSACALRLDQLGFRVFGTLLPGEDGEPLRRKASERLVLIELDITNASSIASAAEAVTKSVGEMGLAGLVNNAGISLGGLVEFVSPAILRKQFEVNVIGQIAVTQAFLPLLRRGQGRIVMMGSMSSRMTSPFASPYAASKAAVQALAAALRVELSPWGLPVSMILPGAIATPIWVRPKSEADEEISSLPQEAQEIYGPAIAVTRKFFQEMTRSGSPPEVVAAAVEHALTSRKAKTCYPVGRYVRLVAFLNHLPDRISDRIIARAMGLPRCAT